MADPFLNGRPMKLSKNGSDVICCCCLLLFSLLFFFISSQFLQQHFALPVGV